MLELTGVCKLYSANKGVENISFAVAPGEVVGLLGPNGAGKSTTMKLITGLLAPTAGSVRMAGCDLQSDGAKTARARLGYLPEIPPLYLDMTVEEQLHFVCGVKSIPPAQTAAEIDRVCGLANIADVKGRLQGHLSKGYRQRVGIAQALVGSPSLLVLDEPTVGLDPQQMLEVRSLVGQLSSEGMSILISSHILSEIASVCSRMVILKQGTVVADATPTQLEQTYRGGNRLRLLARGVAPEALRAIHGIVEITPAEQAEACTAWEVLCEPGVDVREQIFRTVAATGGCLLGMQLVAPSLEEIFIRLTA